MRRNRAFHFLYFFLLIIMLIAIFILQGIDLNKAASQETKNAINIFDNIIYSSIASIIIAWIIDIRSTRQRNVDNKQLAQTVLSPLQASLALLFEDFAYTAYRLSANAEQKSNDKISKRTWIEWMQLWEERDELAATAETINDVKDCLLRGLEHVRIACDALQSNEAFLLQSKVLKDEVFSTFRDIRFEIDCFHKEVGRATTIKNITRYSKPIREDLENCFSQLPLLSWQNKTPYGLHDFTDIYTQHEACKNHPILYRVLKMVDINPGCVEPDKRLEESEFCVDDHEKPRLAEKQQGTSDCEGQAAGTGFAAEYNRGEDGQDGDGGDEN